jgi:hypothetical protein
VYAITFDIKGLPPTFNQMLASHYRARIPIKNDWYTRVRLAASQSGLPEKPLKTAHITLLRASSKEPDIGALNGDGCWKYVLDALQPDPKHHFPGVIENDRCSNISLETRWKKTKPREGWIRVAIEEGKR